MALRTWSSLSSALAVAGALGLAATAGRGPEVAPPAVRPAVALRFEITAPVYRGILHDQQCQQACKALQDRIEVGVRAILQRRFGFLSWEAGGGQTPADTTVVRLAQGNASSVDDPRLEVSIRGPSVTEASPLALNFETWAEAFQRAGTDTAALGEAWLRRVDSILAEKGPRTVTEVLGRVPVNAPVTLNLASLKAYVAIHRDTISAADTPRPEFLVRIEVRESTPFPTVDTAGLVLRGCIPHTSVGYVCQMVEVIPSDPNTAAQDPRAVAQRAQIKVVRLHLKQYWPRTVPTAPGGALPPPGGMR